MNTLPMDEITRTHQQQVLEFCQREENRSVRSSKSYDPVKPVLAWLLVVLKNPDVRVGQIKLVDAEE
jgi:hypothetical protein